MSRCLTRSGVVALGLVAVVATLVAGSCGGSSRVPGDTLPAGTLDIAQVKTADWRRHIGETVEVRGLLHLNDDGTGVLLQDLDAFTHLGILPESRYLAVTFLTTRGLDPEVHDLSLVRIRGVVQATEDPGRLHLADLFGDQARCEISSADVPVVITPRWVAKPEYVNPCDNSPGLCDQAVVTSPDKYAILFCGGLNKDKAFECLWNDMALFHTVLTWIYGFDPDNIIVVYKDGVPENALMTVHHPGSPIGLTNAFQDLASKMGEHDLFFLFMTNHGDITLDADSPYPGDELSVYDDHDECGFYYETSSILYDEWLAKLVDGLEFDRMCCIVNQCKSGGMIYDLRGPNRVICTVCRETEDAVGGLIYSPFPMLFASALIGHHQETGDPVDADEDGNGLVSIYEAFRWVAQHALLDATPQYEDSGEGIPIAFPIAGVTVDGAYGSTFHL